MQTAHSFGGYLFGKNLKVCRENVPSNFKLKDVREGYKSAELLSIGRRKEDVIPNTIQNRIKNLVGLEYSAKYLGSSGYSMGEECAVFVAGVKVSIQQRIDNLNTLEEFYYNQWNKLLENFFCLSEAVDLDGKIFELICKETNKIQEEYDKRNLVGR